MVEEPKNDSTKTTQELIEWIDSIIHAEHTEIDAVRGTAMKIKIPFPAELLSIRAKLLSGEKFSQKLNLSSDYPKDLDDDFQVIVDAICDSQSALSYAESRGYTGMGYGRCRQKNILALDAVARLLA